MSHYDDHTIQLKDNKFEYLLPAPIITFPFNLQNGTGHLLGCYGEGEGRVDYRDTLTIIF